MPLHTFGCRAERKAGELLREIPRQLGSIGSSAMRAAVNHDCPWRCRRRGAILAASTLIGNHLSVKKCISEIVGRRLSDPDAADALV